MSATALKAAQNGRAEATRRLALKQVPTITILGLTADEKRAIVIADNRLPQQAIWDFDLGRRIGIRHLNLLWISALCEQSLHGEKTFRVSGLNDCAIVLNCFPIQPHLQIEAISTDSLSWQDQQRHLMAFKFALPGFQISSHESICWRKVRAGMFPNRCPSHLLLPMNSFRRLFALSCCRLLRRGASLSAAAMNRWRMEF
jgi:hypothetical protein